MWEYVEGFSEIEKALNETSLPRLQVNGEAVNGDYANQNWRYVMVYKHFADGIVKLPINEGTRQASGATSLLDDDGNIDPTMRISADSKWDSIQLKLPLFYIADGKVQKVNLTKFKELMKDKIENELN